MKIKIKGLKVKLKCETDNELILLKHLFGCQTPSDQGACVCRTRFSMHCHLTL